MSQTVEPTTRPLLHKLTDKLLSSTECGSCYEDLSYEEKILIDIFFWMRNVKKTKDTPIRWGFRSAPQGFLSHGVWFPNPEEGCDALGHGHKMLEAVSSRIDRFYNRKHCQTRDHIAYLYKHRFSYLICLSPGVETLWHIVEAIISERVPLLIGIDKPFVADFVAALCRDEVEVTSIDSIQKTILEHTDSLFQISNDRV